MRRARKVSRPKLAGVRNVGFERNIGGVIVPPGAFVRRDDARKALVQSEGGELAAPLSELERFAADWPQCFAREYE